MVQQIVSAFIETLKTVGDTLLRLAPALALTLAGLAVVSALLWATDREGFKNRAAAVGEWLRRGWAWAAFAILLSVLWLFLQEVGPIVGEEQNQQLQVQYTSHEDPSIAGVSQYGPIAAYVQQHTFTRTLKLPPAFLDQIGTEGIQVLAPYVQDPTAENVLKLADTFRRSGKDVLFTREVTQLEETPIPFDHADVKVKLNFRDTGVVSRRSFYDADLDAKYVFKNPLSTPATGRFRFTLPETGTIRGFQMSVNGTAVKEPDQHDAYVWEGTLQPGETATAILRYQTQGGGVWRYDIGSGRRRIEAFTLTVDANEPARFLRGALYPTRRDGSRMFWELGNVITSQHVDLYFPGRGASLESRSKVLDFLPISLIVFLAGVLLLGWRQALRPEPAFVALATVGFAIGIGSTAILLLYMPLMAAVLVAAALATALALRVLGLRFFLPAALASILPLVFVSDVHSGLIALFAVAVAFLLLLPKSVAPIPEVGNAER